MANDYKDILNISVKKKKNPKNTLKAWMNWDSNDGDMIESTKEMEPEVLFSNKKLIYCLAYVSCPYDFKGHDWNGDVFNHHIPDNRDIEGLCEILEENYFMTYSEWGPCHSLYGLKITYYDEKGVAYAVTFDDIVSQFEKMTYEEICDFINSIEE